MLQRLNAFIEVAKKRSLTLAAKELYISQPALSKQMKLLENELGFPVFTRTSSGIKLTEKGEGLYKELSPLFERIDETVAHFQSQEAIHFGSTPFLISYYLHEFYEKLHRVNLHVTVVEEDSQDLLPSIEEGKIDAAIVQDVSFFKSIPSAYLFAEEFVAAVPIDCPLASKHEVTIEECMNYKQIIPSQGSLSEKIKRVITEYHYEGEIIETQYHAMAGLVSLGVGIAYLPDMMVRQVEYRGVHFLPIRHTPFKREMHLYARTSEMLNHLYAVFKSR